MKTKLRVVMAAVLVALLSLGSVASVFAQGGAGRPFITKWQGKAGEELKLPILGTDYKLVIKNEKGEEVKSEAKVTVTSEGKYHPFTPKTDGVYTVEAGPEGVRSMYMRGEWNNGNTFTPLTSNYNLLEVVQFGTVAWQSMRDMFYGCKQMTFAANIDRPDLTKVTDMSSMFSYSSSFNQPLAGWDVSKVTNMYNMFHNCTSFNQPLNDWKVGSVTDMGHMFNGCSSFNQPLAGWDVSKVTSMMYMFDGCTFFNQSLNDWKVGSVTYMRSMFQDCTSFNQSLAGWDVSKVTSMEDMFHGCTFFNQPLAGWDVSKVTYMRSMFAGCTSFNQPLNDWKVGSVTDMGYMFYDCTSFNQPLAGWDVSKVTDMRSMFSECSSFNQSLAGWDVSKVTSMSRLFYNCRALNQPMGNWTFCKEISSTEDMFYGCSSFNQSLGGWKIQKAIGGLRSTAMSPSNYSATLVDWAAQSEIAENVNFGSEVRGLVYNNEGKTAREALIAKGWSFDGDKYQGSGVAITPRSLRLVLTKERILSLEKWGVEDTEEVTLKSSEEGVISYALTEDKKGVRIKGLKEGACRLTATIAAKDGGHEAYTSTCEIRVYVPVESISLSTTAKTLAVGESYTLVAKVMPENATEQRLRWNSSDNGLAINYAGGITAVRPGVYRVTVTSQEEGSTVRNTCTVTVVEKKTEEEVTDIALSLASITLTEGATLTFNAKVMPASAAAQGVTWSSSASEIATVENGKVTAKKVGKCTITAKSKAKGSKVEAKCEITVVAQSNNGGNNGGGNNGGNNGGGNGGGTVKPGAVEDALLADIVVAPNPFSTQLHVENPAGVMGRYELVNASGVVVRSGVLAGTDLFIDTATLPAGIYFVRLEAQNGATKSVKVIKY
ncbi:MAG: BspA family leucine-rich repeat surface protein [Bacteroides sp.]